MSDTTEKRKRRRGFGLWMLLSLAFVSGLGLIAANLLSGRQMEAPEWVKSRVELALNSSLAGGQVEVGAIGLAIGQDWAPVIELTNVSLSDRTALPIAAFEYVEVQLGVTSILRGQVQPAALRIEGASLSLRREPDGRFDLSLETTGAEIGPTGSLADVLDSIDRLFEMPQLAAIETVRAEGVTFQYEDVRAARYWVATGGALEMDQDPEKIELRLGFELLYGQDTPAQAALSFTSFKGSPRASFAANIRDLPGADFSSQAPALAWLEVIDAPVSGAVRAQIDDTGLLASMNGTLELGAGALAPTETTRPIRFDRGRAYFTYNPAEEEIVFDEVSVFTEALTLRADGKAYLRDMRAGWPSTMLGQFRFSQLTANPGEMFDAPVAFDGGALDLRLRLDPFEVSIGQLVLLDGESAIKASGEVTVADDGWNVAMDMALDTISPERLLAYWPPDLVPKTREWVGKNVSGGVLSNISAVLRFVPNAQPRVSVGFHFEDAVVRYMKTLPPVTSGVGFASITEDSFSLAIESGQVAAPDGGLLDVADSVIRIPQIRLKPPTMEIALRLRGEIPSVLSVLDEPPFEFLSKAGQPTDLASGRADLRADIGFTLAQRIEMEDVDYSVTGTLYEVESETLVEGRHLRADELTVRANPEGIEIAGAGTLDEVPARAAWRQDFGPENRGRSHVEGTVELSQVFADTFGLTLPDGSLRGAGSGRFEIDLTRDAPSRFTLVSDLNRLGIRLRDLGWSKPQNRTGRLEVSGTLGKPATIDALELTAPGLEARGRVTLNSDGTFDEARFSRVRVGRWLDAPVVLSGRGAGRTPGVSVTGGMIDIRETQFGRGGGSGQGGPISLALDRLVVSEGITLTDLRGQFQRAPAFNGRFTALVNGEAAITGTLAPQDGGTAIRIQSEDAGAVMRASGIIDKAYGGVLDLILIPRAEEGTYNGLLNAEQVRVRDAPALAELLSAVSVIGLLEQLNGQGLVFGEVQANFRLTPQQVIITRGSAVGASLGVSMDGIYDLATRQLDMQGVISPIYVVNAIGAIFTRRGEGLFGFNYRLTGKAEDPRVSVNPLSILTPGMFRDIFRRPPPELPE